MTATTSKQKLRGTSRDEIIDVSRAIIEDEGVEQLTIRRIAETINRTQPAVYQHFSGKEAILEAVVTDGFAALVERLKRAPRSGKTPLVALVNAYVRFGLDRPRLYDLMFVGPPAITFAAGAATPIPAQTAFNIMAAAVAESGVPRNQIDTVTEIIWASLHGLVTLSITKRLRPGRALQQTRLEHLTAAILAMAYEAAVALPTNSPASARAPNRQFVSPWKWERNLMKIGIIGAGHIGSALTRRFRAAGHEVSIANSRGPETLADLARETGAKAVTVQEAARGNDVVVVTIPMKRIEDLPRHLFAGAPKNLVVIDTNNYYPRQRDGRIDGIEQGMTESEWVQQQLGHPVIKAFNNIYAAHLQGNGKPKGTPGRIALPVSGDDPAAKAVVMKLVDEIGFDPYDNGSLADSWRQQPGSPVYTHDLDLEHLPKALAAASKEREPEWKATNNSPGTYDSPR